MFESRSNHHHRSLSTSVALARTVVASSGSRVASPLRFAGAHLQVRLLQNLRANVRERKLNRIIRLLPRQHALAPAHPVQVCARNQTRGQSRVPNDRKTIRIAVEESPNPSSSAMKREKIFLHLSLARARARPSRARPSRARDNPQSLAARRRHALSITTA